MGNVTSPCNNICKLNTNDICTGCFRTIAEISNWAKYTDEEKSAIIRQLQNRIQGDSYV
jgi:predicted Fe-S protein YdhL (DUF1289 family)